MKLNEAAKQILFREEIEDVLSGILQKLKLKSGHMSYGLLEISINKNKLVISFAGNMGATIERSIDPILKKLDMPSLSKLKALYPKALEKGDPDYSWALAIPLTAAQLAIAV